MSTKSYLGKGSIYLEEIGGTAGLLPIGNCSALTLTFNEEKKEQKDYEDAGGAVVDSVSRISSVTGAMTALNLNSDNIALAIRGLTAGHTSAVQTTENHTAKSGALIPFTFLPDTGETILVTDTGAAETFTVDVDYEIKNSGIKVIEGGGIAADTALEITYTSIDSTTVEGLTVSGKNYRLYFDGLNEADGGKPVIIDAHRTNFNPAQALDLISDEFAELPMTFDILKDVSVVGAAKSKFVKITAAD